MRKGVDHVEMVIGHDPYLTAWFCYNLKDDKEAAITFCGENAKFLKNDNLLNCQTQNL